MRAPCGTPARLTKPTRAAAAGDESRLLAPVRWAAALPRAVGVHIGRAVGHLRHVHGVLLQLVASDVPPAALLGAVAVLAPLPPERAVARAIELSRLWQWLNEGAGAEAASPWHLARAETFMDLALYASTGGDLTPLEQLRGDPAEARWAVLVSVALGMPKPALACAVALTSQRSFAAREIVLANLFPPPVTVAESVLYARDALLAELFAREPALPHGVLAARLAWIAVSPPDCWESPALCRLLRYKEMRKNPHRLAQLVHCCAQAASLPAPARRLLRDIVAWQPPPNDAHGQRPAAWRAVSEMLVYYDLLHDILRRQPCFWPPPAATPTALRARAWDVLLGDPGIHVLLQECDALAAKLRDPLRLFVYAARLQPYRARAALFSETVAALALGTYRAQRLRNSRQLQYICQPDARARSRGEVCTAARQAVLQQWLSGATLPVAALCPDAPPTAAAWTLSDTDSADDFLGSGVEIGTCQSVFHFDPTNHGLLARLSDAARRMLVVHNERGTLMGRAMWRILHDEEGAPVLHLSQLYCRGAASPLARQPAPAATPTLAAEVMLCRTALVAFARRRAAALRLPLLGAGGLGPPYPGTLHCLAAVGGPPDYWDECKALRGDDVVLSDVRWL